MKSCKRSAQVICKYTSLILAVSLNVGFGFVRGIDTEKRLFYIVTPLLPEEMQFVNCITIGAVTLPTGVISSQAQRLDKTSNSKVLSCCNSPNNYNNPNINLNDPSLTSITSF